jgi:hypothetical protein
MTQRHLQVAIAVVFLIVGILATANTFRLNAYIRSTLPRDAAQEQCQDDTLTVLSQWIQQRIKRDTSMNSRDEAVITILDKMLATNNQPSPEDLEVWRQAVAADREVRLNATAESLPLPHC